MRRSLSPRPTEVPPLRAGRENELSRRVLPRCHGHKAVGRGSLILIGLASATLQGCANLPSGRAVAALPHFVQVDEGLYRGGQPSEEGMRELTRMGIKTVVSLRHSHAERLEERRLAEQLGLRWVSLPMRFWKRPTDTQVRNFLAIASDPASRPVFMHCHQGQNRTGMMVAVYRIVHDGWPPQRAYDEARRLGLASWNIAGRRLILEEAEQKFVRSEARPQTSDMREASAPALVESRARNDD